MISTVNLAGGRPTPLKNDGVKVSWDYEIPSRSVDIKHVPNHQPDILLFQLLTVINHGLTID